MASLCCTCGFGRSNIKFLPCNHVVHARCLFPWSVESCPSCAGRVESVQCSEVEAFESNGEVMDIPSSISRAFGILRRGRWTKEEQDYALVLMGTFNAGLLTLKERTKLGTFLCKMLQCSSARLSPKIKTGKKVFHSKRFHGNLDDSELLHYQGVQKKLSQLEDEFLRKIAEMCEKEEANVLSYHIQYFWTREFLESYGSSSSFGTQKRIVEIYASRYELSSSHFEVLIRGVLSSLTDKIHPERSSDLFKPSIRELLAKLDAAHPDFTSVVADVSTGELLYVSPTVQALASQRVAADHLRVLDDFKNIFGNAEEFFAALSQIEPSLSFESIVSAPAASNIDHEKLAKSLSHGDDEKAPPVVYRRDLSLYVSLYDKLLASASEEEGDYCLCSMYVVRVGAISIASMKFDRAPIRVLEEVAIATKGSLNTAGTAAAAAADVSGNASPADIVGEKRRRSNNINVLLPSRGSFTSTGSASPASSLEKFVTSAYATSGDVDGHTSSGTGSMGIPGDIGGDGAGAEADADWISGVGADRFNTYPAASSSSYSASTLSVQDAVGPFIFDITLPSDSKRQRLDMPTATSAAAAAGGVGGEAVQGIFGVGGLLTADAEEKSEEMLLKNPIIDIIYSSKGSGAGQPLQRSGTASDIPTLLSAKTTIPKASRELNSKKHTFEEILQSLLRVVPFHVVEVWVPVQLQDNSTVLLYGGSAAKDKELLGWSAYSRNFFFKPEVGLPGRVSSAHSAESQPDVSSLPMPTFLRAEMAGSLGIHAACGIPFLTGSNCDAVVVFYSRYTFEPTRQLIEFMSRLCESLNIRAQIRTLKQQILHTSDD